MIRKDGSQIEIVTITENLDKAKQSGLDLLEISSNTNPPVCKIIDYSKYCYQLTKKEHE